MGQNTFIDWDDDLAGWDNFLAELDDNLIGFFRDLDNYRWVPTKVGDLFSIKGYGYGAGQQIFEVVRFENENSRWDHFNNVTYTLKGQVRKDGYYDYVGFISSLALRLYASKGCVIKRKRASLA